MANPVISVRNLSKRYQLGATLQHDTLRDHIVHAARSFKGMFRQNHGDGISKTEIIWALRDVSFDVQQGVVLGVIGRNGAGKSTLLKILSQITEPTEGEVRMRGRVASLLEVGTGFHPELTGRENIFLNGAILGMKRAEVRKKFDEIVSFAEMEKFLDTPVKRYSSGMYVRLAFAVAAHLETDILLIDEVLAVGDSRFQRRCLGRMSEVVKGGRTVLFVSHNMSAMAAFCQRAIWIDEGRIAAEGTAGEVVRQYLRDSASDTLDKEWPSPQDAPGNDAVRLRRVRVCADDPATNTITLRTPVRIEIEYWNLVPDTHLNVLLHVLTQDGTMAFGSSSTSDVNWHGRPFPGGLFRTVCRIPGDLLNTGTYYIRLSIVKNQSVILYTADNILCFEVADAPELRRGWYGKFAGVVRPRLDWSTNQVENLSSEIAPLQTDSQVTNNAQL